ncbi:hypothetical protein MIMGU_mgv1a022613mg [Erythranthe guttata]|uniref:Cystatin domain-containing protein n=1 Tax=Erythranthe guttata TaxID=4155 RepID=A0A022R7A1_ERYGU|nr:hypothetical protein MIMGU_mgv1a022613mg [Erythranthe guttata]
MATISCSVLLIFFLVLVESFISLGEAFGGGMWPIEDLNNRLVLFVAKFAVAEYNKKANATLQFETIIKGKEHMVARSIYHLLISAKDSSAPKKYETAVSFISWSKKSFKLESFKNYQSQSLFSNN